MKEKRKYAIVSYNIHYNYSNYGSILQTFALQEAVKRLSDKIEVIVLDYCPKRFLYADPLHPSGFKDSPSGKEESTAGSLLSDIRENEFKIRRFIKENYALSKHAYTAETIDSSAIQENLDGYICGSDAIWSIDYFGEFDTAFFANCDSMRKKNTIAYAASFGESMIHDDNRSCLLRMIENYRFVSCREDYYLDKIGLCKQRIIPRTMDPTLLLSPETYKRIAGGRLIQQPYLLIYSRSIDQKMVTTAESIANKRGLSVVDISLSYENASEHIMMYSAGIEEFLSLILYAEYIITNSLHGTILSVLLERPFFVFLRKNGRRKIQSFLSLIQQEDRIVDDDNADISPDINLQVSKDIISEEREKSFAFLKEALLT